MENLNEEQQLVFDTYRIILQERGLANRFSDVDEPLSDYYENALKNRKHKLHRVALEDHLKYAEYQHLTVGEFLMLLKQNGNLDYKRYLHRYGDLEYCKFHIDNLSTDKGIYKITVDDEDKYLGLAKDFKRTINSQLGKVSPTDCLVNGTMTNARINFHLAILPDSSIIKVSFCKLNDMSDHQLFKIKKEILVNNNFPWVL